MEIKKFIIGVLLFLGFSSISFAQGPAFDPKEYIEWSESQKLTWDFFKGEAIDNTYGDAATAIKIQAIPFFQGKEINYNVHALFVVEKSWYREKSTELLAHEQLHFDIAELTAREVRKEIAALKKKKVTDPKQINIAIEKILKRSNHFDALYDRQTLHGLLEDKQKEWQKKVTVKMKKLEEYKTVSQ